ncbi:MAG: hypothetical protein IJ413_11525 [Bacteroides sp.]|nr:hypothetical protein [Bacteroides sp.]
MKKFIKFAFVAAIAAVAGYNVYQSQSVMDNMSEFALANVEALADGENDSCKGGVANVRCPIWDIRYSASWNGPSVDCYTGGDWKCEAGTCPHGK